MSLLGDVLAQVRAGVSVDRIPTLLGSDPGLVAAALDHWERVGIITGASGILASGCGGSCGHGANEPGDDGAHLPMATLACAGCVFTLKR